MSKRIILLVLGTCFLVSSLAASSTALWLSFPTSGSYPVVNSMSQVEDPLFPSHPAVMSVYRAFRDVYGPLWYEQYVLPDAQLTVNRLANEFLASHLPADPYVLRSKVYPDYVLVPIILHDADTVVKIDLFLQKEENGVWKIGELSLR